MNRFQVRILGRFGFDMDGKSVPLPSRGNELIAFLAVQPGGCASRRRVSGVLWPDLTDERALGNLNTTLWRLRRAVLKVAQPDFIHVTRWQIGLNTNRIQVDYWEFERCVEGLLSGNMDPSSMGRALALYSGELLEGNDNADWLQPERERTRLRYLQVLRHCAEWHARNGSASEALRMYERLLGCDPLNEEACREMMKIFNSIGKRIEALRLFSSFARHLQAELGVDADTETLRLFEAIRAGNAVSSRAPQVSEARISGSVESQFELVGRDTELREFHSFLLHARGGKLTFIGIEGEVGIGKTRLATEFSRIAAMQGWKVLFARCEEFPKAGPYETLRTLFRSSPALAVGTNPALEEHLMTSDDPSTFSGGLTRWNPKMESEARVELYEGIASELQNQANQNPLIVILEDLQFSDSASLDLLNYVADQLRDCKLMFLLTWRQEDCPPRVDRFLKSRGVVRRILRLPRLTESEVQRLCEAFLGTVDLPRHLGIHVHNESEGNPLFALELLRSLRASDQVDGSGPGLGGPLSLKVRTFERVSGRSVVPDGIPGIISRRCRRLPGGTRRLLQFAAACGRKLDLDVLRRATNVSSEEMIHSLEILMKAGFITATGSDYEFLHDKIREICYEELVPSRKVEIHWEVLKVLEASYPDRLDDLAFHSERAEDGGRASRYWERVGDRATGLWAHLDAASAYTKALENWHRHRGNGNDKEVRFGLLKKRAHSWEYLGELEKGETDIHEMLRVADDIGDQYRRCEAMSLESRFLLRLGLLRRAFDRAQESLDLARKLQNPRLEASSREILGLVHYRSRNYEKAEQEFHQLVAFLEALDDSEALERVWNNIGRIQAVHGSNLQCLQSLERAEKFWTNDLNERALRCTLRGIALTFMGKGDEAILTLRLAERDFHRAGNSSGEARTSCLLSTCDVLKGNLSSAVIRGRKGLPFKCGKNDIHWVVTSASHLGSCLFLALGNYKSAKRILQKSLSFASPPEAAGNVSDTLAIIALEERQLELARALAEDALRKVSSVTYVGGCLVTLARVHLAQGQARRAVDILRDAVAIFERIADYLPLTQALSFLGVALKLSGFVDESLACSQRAVKLLVSNGEFCFRAQEIYWNHFQLLQDLGDPAAAGDLDRAYRIVMRQAAQLGRKGRAKFLAVPVNREIVDAWEKRLGPGRTVQPPALAASIQGNSRSVGGRVSVLIPMGGAPWGRPLHPNEFVEVILTVDAGKGDEMLRQLKGEVGLRRARILRLCAEANVQGGDPRESDLARALGVSTRTIRTDIAYLRSQGCGVQTRGGKLHSPPP